MSANEEKQEVTAEEQKPEDQAIQKRKRNAPETRSTKKKRITEGPPKPTKTIAQTDAPQKPKEKQAKLYTYFGGVSNGLSRNRSTNTFNSYIPNEMEIKINALEEDLAKKAEVIDKMQKDRDTEQAKYSKLYLQKKTFSAKARLIIAQNMREIAEIRRRQRSQICPLLGYYKDGSFRQFIQGEQVIKLRARLQLKQKQIKQLELQKSAKKASSAAKEKASCSIEFFQKQLHELKQEWHLKQKELQGYKQRLRLAQKEQQCHYAQEGWPIVKDRFHTLQLLGSGGFGEVYKCFDLDENEIVALKINKISPNKDEEQSEEFKKHIFREIDTQQKLNHPNIAKFIQLIQLSDKAISFVLEYCEGPELSKYLKKYKCLEEKQAKHIIKQILSALYYLYNLSQKVIHYDLKPSNIIFHQGQIKILDFGLCKLLDHDQTRMELTSQGVGTYWYLPPQTFDTFNPQVTPKLDIWSVGVIFFELLYGRRPFGHGISQNRIYNEGLILKATQVDFPAQTPKKYKVSEGAKQFIMQCLKYDLQERLNPDQAYYHPYIRK